MVLFLPFLKLRFRFLKMSMESNDTIDLGGNGFSYNPFSTIFVGT